MRYLTLLWLALAPAALAQDGDFDSAKALYQAGVQKYDAGSVDEAIALWERAFEMSPVPGIMYNIAFAHDERGDSQQALEAWRAYLEVAPEADQAKTRTRIRELELITAALSAPAQGVQQPPPPAVPVPDSSPLAEVPAAGLGRGVTVAALGLSSLGSLGGGSYMALHAWQRAVTAAELGCVTSGGATLCDADTQARLDEERGTWTAGSALAGAGVLLGAAAVMTARASEGDEPDAVSLILQPTGAALHARF
ncbi:MAG: hypothetical protein JXX28_15950 [Deltaproteobacteria bacterium]|nr:hypothetical protein [Deltaproteobacteria bacterium]